MFGDSLRKLLSGLTAAALLVITTSCDGDIKMRGRVYTQHQPGTQSRAYVDQAPTDDLSGLTPLEGAKIVLYHGGDYDKQPIDTSTLWKEEGESDAVGQFDVGGTTAPSKFHAALVIKKPGYKPVTQVFMHEKFDHTAVVILVPDEQINKNH